MAHPVGNWKKKGSRHVYVIGNIEVASWSGGTLRYAVKGRATRKAVAMTLAAAKKILPDLDTAAETSKPKTSKPETSKPETSKPKAGKGVRHDRRTGRLVAVQDGWYGKPGAKTVTYHHARTFVAEGVVLIKAQARSVAKAKQGQSKRLTSIK